MLSFPQRNATNPLSHSFASRLLPLRLPECHTESDHEGRTESVPHCPTEVLATFSLCCWEEMEEVRRTLFRDRMETLQRVATSGDDLLVQQKAKETAVFCLKNRQVLTVPPSSPSLTSLNLQQMSAWIVATLAAFLEDCSVGSVLGTAPFYGPHGQGS